MALGIVLTPYGKIPGSFPAAISYSYGGNGTFVEPHDPQYHQRGEDGYYHDTHLRSPRLSWRQRIKARRALRGVGAIPPDFEIGRAGAAPGNYTPVMSAWIDTTNQGYYQPPPWQPSPAGAQPPAWLPGTYAPGHGLAGLREGEAPATVNDVVA